MQDNKKVFISYSWTSQERVIELAERLIANGIDVVLDVYDLREGQDKYAFMEQSVNDPSIDRVLIICDKSYTEKANNRSGGVGDETVIISPEIYGQVKQEKFIPIIFEVDEEGNAYCPQYIKSRIYIDLSTEDDRYEAEYEKLLRNIFEKPIYKKPALGTKPKWLENDIIDLSSIRDIVKQTRGYTNGNQVEANFLLRKAADEFVDVAKQYKMPDGNVEDENIMSAIEQTKPYRDLFVDFCEALIYSSLPVSNTLTMIFEMLFNGLHDAGGRNGYSRNDFDFYDFLIMELFICTTAVLLHYEKYGDLHLMLTHTYFVKENYCEDNVKSTSYFEFRKYIREIEDKYKPKSGFSNLITLTGDIIVNRERKPLLTKNSISNADIVLYQLGVVLKINTDVFSCWFPTTYIYHGHKQAIWQKLKSREYCQKIAPLFGVSSAEEVKSIISNSDFPREIGYNHAFDSAPSILRSIRFEEIGSMN